MSPSWVFHDFMKFIYVQRSICMCHDADVSSSLKRNLSAHSYFLLNKQISQAITNENEQMLCLLSAILWVSSRFLTAAPVPFGSIDDFASYTLVHGFFTTETRVVYQPTDTPGCFAVSAAPQELGKPPTGRTRNSKERHYVLHCSIEYFQWHLCRFLHEPN